jgi:hypothetical protein
VFDGVGVLIAVGLGVAVNVIVGVLVGSASDVGLGSTVKPVCAAYT